MRLQRVLLTWKAKLTVYIQVRYQLLMTSQRRLVTRWILWTNMQHQARQGRTLSYTYQKHKLIQNSIHLWKQFIQNQIKRELLEVNTLLSLHVY